MTERRHIRISCFLFFTMAVSSFVVIEPSPYDLLIILIIIIGFAFSIYNFSREVIFPILMLCIFLISNLLSLFFIEEIGPSIFYTAISFYLALTWIGIIGMRNLLKWPYLQIILHGYLVSACISATIGILAYFQLIPNSEFFLMYGRVKALFKDPNVFGPFLVMPALFALSMTELKNTLYVKRIFYYISFFILFIGIILSFSRAAWGNFILSLLVFLSLYKGNFFKKRVNTIIFIVLIGIPGILYFIQTPMVEDLLASRLSYQGYDDNRFDTQIAALKVGFSNPLGIGAGQTEVILKTSTHSLYARLFVENGFLGFLSFLGVLIACIYKSFKSFINSDGDIAIFHLVVFTSLIGLVFNSFFVDTLHWRHLWLLLILAWIPANENID